MPANAATLAGGGVVAVSGLFALAAITGFKAICGGAEGAFFGALACNAGAALDRTGGALTGIGDGGSPAALARGEAATGVVTTEVLVTSAWAAIEVLSSLAPGRSTNETTTTAPAVAPIAVATKTMRSVRMKLGAGAR